MHPGLNVDVETPQQAAVAVSVPDDRRDPVTTSELARIVRMAAAACDSPVLLALVAPNVVRVLAASPGAGEAPDLATAHELIATPPGSVIHGERTSWIGATVVVPAAAINAMLLTEAARLDPSQAQAMRDFAALATATISAEAVRHDHAALEELIGATVHDLRNPLSVLRAGLETLSEHRDQLPKQQQDRIADLAMRQARRMSVLLDELLAMHGLDITEGFEDVDIVAVLRDVLESGRLIHQMVELRTFAPLPTEPVIVRGIPDAIARLVTNLVTNAAIHGGGRVSVGLESSVDAAIITISDDGPGMPDDTPLDGGDTQRSVGGHGLGLVIARRLADTHRGTITHRPGKSGGTHLEVHLPLARRQRHVRLP